MARFNPGGRREKLRADAVAGADTGPTGEDSPRTVELPLVERRARRTAVPFSVALLNKQSVGGASAILLVALFFILVVPAVGDAMKGAELTVGVPLAVGEQLQVTPPPGWVHNDKEGDASTVVTKSGAQLSISPATAPTEAVVTQIQTIADDLADDPDNSWVVTPPTTFTTTAGDSGATVTAQSKDSATQVWVISNADLQTTLVLRAPLAVWDVIADGADTIAASVKFTPEELP